jgi:cation diffusion facilitator family transporter
MSAAASLLPALAICGVLAAQVPDPAAAAPPQAPFAPGVTYDPRIPTLEQVAGHAPGAEISAHADVEKYLQALAAASPNVRLVEYGRSWEGRRLWYAIVASEANLARLEQVQQGMRRLADPRGLADAEADKLVADLPAVGWLANCVHGDEPSGTDAALHVLYHLLAAKDDPVADRVRQRCVILVDPLQNPDGRDRFVHSTRAARGRWPDATPLGAEHSQPWPGGRSNHALFDMNRDWFAMSQPETQARVRAFLDWWPLVYVDLHEMSGDASYYFAPPAEPVHSEITAGQRGWLSRYGRNNARWFDRFGFDYFTREAYDSFYPGYGEGWPTFQGSIGMTYEMASSRGLVFRRRDDSLLHYRDGVHRHFVASMATLETLADGREEALRSFLQHRRAGIARGDSGAVREYVFPDRGDRTRLARLCNLLIAQGIEVHRATGELRATARPLTGGEPAAQVFPAGSYVVSMAQPASTLAHVLLEPHFDMDPAFLEEQKRREARRLGTEFYDLSAWALPLLFGVEAWTATEASSGERRLLRAGEADSGAAPLRAEPPQVAYVVAWGQNGAAALLAELLRLGTKVRCIGRAFTLEGTTFPAGSFVVRVQGQPADLHDRLRELAAAHGVSVHNADSSWVDSGPNFGTNWSLALEVPRVAMAWDLPVNANSAGWVRYLLEQRYGVPVTPLRTRQIDGVDLDRFTVLILPEGGAYASVLGKSGASAIKGFVERGGVLITLGSATRWLVEEDVKLLASEAEPRQKPKEPGAPDKKTEDGEQQPAAAPEQPFDYQKAIRPDKEPPPATPGAILAVTIDPDHWLGFGYDGSASVVHDSSHILTPVKLDRGTNVAIYADADRLVRAGFVWDESKRQLPQKAFLVHQPHGRGHVVAFAEDPNVRAFADGLNLLLLNAVLLTAGRGGRERALDAARVDDEPVRMPANAGSEPGRHTSVAALSLFVGVLVLGAKFWAYALTGSQAVFSDALESIVNVVAAAFALGVLAYAGRPADRDHPFGHGKVEFFSAAFEGGLIFCAALVIIWQAGEALFAGAVPQRIDVGLALTIAAGLANGALGWFLVRYGRRHHSPALEADGHHLLSDFWTTVGVVAGLGGVWMTGLGWLDPVAAAVVALLLLRTGWRLVRRATGGLLDEEDPELLQRLVGVIGPRVREGVIRVHHLRAIRSGPFRHISAHLVVPEFWSVERAHDTAEALGSSVLRELGVQGAIDFHTDPCERLYCGTCDLESCSVRRRPFEGLRPLTVDEAVRPDPEAHGP